MNARFKLFLTGFLLCIALGVVVFCATQTWQAIQRFEQYRHLTLSGDVSTIRPWMTIPYIARVYHVPESYLDTSLHITNPQDQRKAPLSMLATRFNRPVDRIIHDVQQAILTYRKQHKTPTTHATTTQHQQGPPLAMGRRSP